MKSRPPIATLDSRYWKCNWLNCFAGMGLAGSGVCFLEGKWWLENCPCFKDDWRELVKLYAQSVLSEETYGGE